MITDKQGREWVLQKLYDDGWRYIVGSLDDYVYITQREPTIVNGFFRSIGLCEIYKHIELKSVLPSLECGEIMNIAEELGITDWSKVPVDTPVLISNDKEIWFKRYFARYEDGKVYCWLNGKTSWTAECEFSTGHWDYAKLAEV